MESQNEIKKRLTFAIISHPDAGKTTITEKLLLFGKAIHAAGAVKSNRTERKTTSDFMEMEKQRGISVSTSVMGFNWKGRKVNLLDTPGHADFSEDTYRTLTAVDSTLMVIDSVKGVEERTRKLCEICRMRRTPIITYINKMDRDGKDPIELMDEVETELNVKISPMSWPVGQGKNFKGVYSLYEKRLILFSSHGTQEEDHVIEITDLNDEKLDIHVGHEAAKLREEIELINAIYPPFDREQYLSGLITPVFFGSAINNFGVRELLDCLVDIAPFPVKHDAEERTVEAVEEKFSGFIFKIHANLDPKHRDRIAFLRICSGKFEKNKQYLHVRSGKPFKTATPTAFMAQDRNIIDYAYPGDIVGLHDTGTFKIGDTLTEGEKIRFKGIPSFAPQIFRSVRNLDPLKSKQFNKGLQQLAEEGVVQLFTKKYTNEKLLGVVGMLQLDVIKYRLEHEYKATCRFDSSTFTTACWIRSEDKKALDHFISIHSGKIAEDVRGDLVFLAVNKWLLERTLEEFSKIKYYFTSDYD
ncbi:MAG: peptide chain release factor 3 [Spirochaetaceae bacterium]|jgi:peptide chain release factor 3|nr:peptide chain release factor 3 [Spirochaetaceae bacterium]